MIVPSSVRTLVLMIILALEFLNLERIIEARAAPSQRTAPPSDRSMPVYHPPKDNVPHARIESGMRGEGGNDLKAVALVPDHVGFTIKKDPTLYWHASHATSFPILFTLTDSRSVRSIAEFELPRPSDAGFQPIRLKDYGISLDPGIQYRWSVSIQKHPDQPSKDLVTGGMIERIDFNEGSAFGLPLTCNRDAVPRYAEAGLWYDAIACISELIESNASDSHLRTQRAYLLKQIDLAHIAELELHQNGAP